jgi:hypothetical protein
VSNNWSLGMSWPLVECELLFRVTHADLAKATISTIAFHVKLYLDWVGRTGSGGRDGRDPAPFSSRPP